MQAGAAHGNHEAQRFAEEIGRVMPDPFLLSQHAMHVQRFASGELEERSPRVGDRRTLVEV